MKRHIFGILLGLLACLGLISLRLSDPPVMASLRASGFDTLQRLWPRASPPQPVRVVAIDEAALAKLGQWPWPRDRLATLVENLTSLGAQAIVFDILFAEPDRSSPSQLVQDPAVKAMLSTQPGQDLPDHDKAFAAAIAKAPVVLAASALPAASATGPQPKAGFAVTGQEVQTGLPVMEGLVGNLPALDAAARGLGVINIDLAGNGGVVRALPLLWRGGEKPFPSLALEALRVAQGQQTVVVNGSPTLAGAVNSIRVGQIEIPTAEQGALAVYYHHDDPNLYVSAAQLLDPSQLASLRPLIEGHIVLVGATATGLLDTRVSSLGESLPGVAVHAQALEQVLSGQFLSRPEWVADFEMVLVAAAGLAFSILAGLWRPLPLIGALLATL
ncbi:MAG: CHASE2 domain-containing protein, partial [Alphaproteobacteria bacterium]|nr:CHASE2 domain-containing protein [Alphaproteobacteria bacterium]